MTSDEIRSKYREESAWLREIAAQLAELNESIRLLTPQTIEKERWSRIMANAPTQEEKKSE